MSRPFSTLLDSATRLMANRPKLFERLSLLVGLGVVCCLSLVAHARGAPPADGGPSIVTCPFIVGCEFSEVGATSAVLTPTIEANGSDTEYDLAYSEGAAGPWSKLPGCEGIVTAAEGAKELHLEVIGFEPETTNHIRVEAHNEEGWKTQEFEFTTEGLAPSAVGTEELGSTETSLEVAGSLKPHLETQWRLEYATDEGGPWSVFASGSIDASDKLQSTPAVTLGGLATGTKYYLRESLANARGTDSSAPLSFETSGAPTAPPAIESESATDISPRDAVLNAEIDPNGLGTSWGFRLEYGCFSNGSACDSTVVTFLPGGELPASTDTQTVSLDLNAAGLVLHPGWEYRYRVEATNAAGPTVSGPDRAFTTSLDPSPTLAAAATDGSDPASTSVSVPPPVSAPAVHGRRHHRKLHQRRKQDRQAIKRHPGRSRPPARPIPPG